MIQLGDNKGDKESCTGTQQAVPVVLEVLVNLVGATIVAAESGCTSEADWFITELDVGGRRDDEVQQDDAECNGLFQSVDHEWGIVCFPITLGVAGLFPMGSR